MANPSVQFIQQEINGGFAQACNKGAAIAKGEWILFLNPDTILDPQITFATYSKNKYRTRLEINWHQTIRR